MTQRQRITSSVCTPIAFGYKNNNQNLQNWLTRLFWMRSIFTLTLLFGIDNGPLSLILLCTYVHPSTEWFKLKKTIHILCVFFLWSHFGQYYWVGIKDRLQKVFRDRNTSKRCSHVSVCPKRIAIFPKILIIFVHWTKIRPFSLMVMMCFKVDRKKTIARQKELTNWVKNLRGFFLFV